MKKLVLSLAFLGFVAFGVVSVQNLIASSSQIEMANFDKDPKKVGDKKTTEVKAVKTTDAKTTDVKATGPDTKACPSTCSDKSACTDKSASAKSCGGTEKAGCCPDKK